MSDPTYGVTQKFKGRVVIGVSSTSGGKLIDVSLTTTSTTTTSSST